MSDHQSSPSASRRKKVNRGPERDQRRGQGRGQNRGQERGRRRDQEGGQGRGQGRGQERGRKRDQRSAQRVNEGELKDLTSSEKLSELELRVAYHERLNQDLSDQVYALHLEVEELRALLTSVSKRLLRATGEGELKLGPPDETPPHY